MSLFFVALLSVFSPLGCPDVQQSVQQAAHLTPVLFCRDMKVALYLGDISGAFDRVFKDYLLAKLHSAGVADIFLDFLNADEK